MSEPSASTARLTKPLSSLSASASNATVGICNPAFDFEDDEDSQDQVRSIKDELPAVKMSKIEEGMEEDDDGDTVRDDINIPNRHAKIARSLVDNSSSERLTRNHSSVDEVVSSRSAKGREPRIKSNGVTKQSSLGEQDGNADTDEDAQSISLSTVSEASTVIAGEGKLRSSSAGAMVSPTGNVRRGSRKKVISNEGNVKIVEIKSRDVVQGILRMEPKLGASTGGGGGGGGAKDHVAIVKVPLVASSQQKQQQQPFSRSSTQKISSHTTQPLPSALNVSAGSGPNLPNKAWYLPKVRKTALVTVLYSFVMYKLSFSFLLFCSLNAR